MGNMEVHTVFLPSTQVIETLGGVIETLYIEEDKLQLPPSIRGKKADKQRRSPLAGREALHGPSSVGSADLYVKSCEVRTPVQVSPSSGQEALRTGGL